MDLPVANPGPVRDEGQLLQCPYCDSEAMHKLAQFLLPGLAAVCVDGTTGDLFRSPSVVAVDLRQEMVDYITQRSETFIADTLIESEVEQNADNQMPDDPYEVISIFMDDFSRTKRNIIGHVSGWLLSDSREDKIDDFVQEMDMTRFWPLERREGIAEVLLKNVDCEQNCEKRLLRRDMDRHCVTVCPMRPMKCPFGCDSSFPEHNLEEHCSESLQQHLLKVLQVIHKKGFTADQLNDRALELEKSEDRGKLAKARDARSLTNIVK
uniref:TRAF-type domain-containing protein n=1 Tax=Aegilops tauschii subsp. strangulata TaxID=200361 RepID=A0A453T705_AEGTS